MKSSARLSVASCALKRAQPLLGTLVEISASGDTDASVAEAVQQAFAAVERVQARMSYFDTASDVSRINRTGLGRVAVHAETWQLLARARDIAEASAGLFDITIAPTLVGDGYLPTLPGQRPAAPDGNWRHLELEADHQIRLRRPLQIDLGGIAKGYAVDCAVAALEAAGMRRGCVNAGGDIRVFGDTPERIHIRHPLAPSQLMPLCDLREGAVASSAPYFSLRTAHGQRVSPLVDTTTRQGRADARSVSVLADDCAVADALTKVVFADPERALAALSHFGAHATLLDADDGRPGQCRIRTTDGSRWVEVAAESAGATAP